MRMYLPENVLEAATERIGWLFDEFPVVIVNFSGGKDSTVIANLAIEVAREKGRLPVPVFFIDQEAEWASVISYMRLVMDRPEVEPLWLQCPIRIFNATSPFDPWLHCWEPGANWMREKEPNSIHENIYGTDRFIELFAAYMKKEHPGEKCCRITGVRAEESPARRAGLTRGNVYKGMTWGKREYKDSYIFHPIYDWSYTDVWKAIHEHGWEYCPIYDAMYQHGIPTRNMRVSNVHHETAVHTLEYLQEIEGDTWNKLTERLTGVNCVKQLQGGWYAPKQLPPMFVDWREYRDHLCENMIADPDIRAELRKQFAKGEKYIADEYHEELHKLHVNMVLVNDYHGTKWSTWLAAHQAWQRCKQEPA